MIAGRTAAAIRSLLRLPRPRRARPPWRRVAAVVVVPVVVYDLLGPVWCWAAFGLGLGLVLGLLPLFGVLGFELAVVAAVFAAIAGLDVGSALAQASQAEPVRAGYAGRTIASTMLGGARLAVAIVAIPAAVCAIRGIWVPTCDWWFGIVAYLGMPLATAALAGALGAALGIVVGDRRWIAIVVPLVGLAAAGLWRFYSESPVFTYSPIVGYFPGNLYDENIHLGMPLVWSRLEQLAWLVALAAVIATRLDVPTVRAKWREPRPVGRRIGAIGVAAVFAACALTLHHLGGRLGYAVDTSDLEDVLDGRIETAHFVIHYAQTPEISKDIALIARDHELRYAEVVAQLGVAPDGKLRSFYFANSEQKARWFGARNVEMAKPWRREIYLDHRAFPHGSLRHEIAHAVASEFGDPIFGVAVKDLVLFNPGLIEGLAVAVDWPGDYDAPLTPHEAVRALEVMGLVPSLDELLSVQFLAVSSARGYTTAGSFLRFLLDTYGAGRLRALYRSGGDFADTYDKPVGALQAEWRKQIDAIELPPAVVEGTRERFRSGSVFARPCPHAIAARSAQAERASSPREAIALMRHVCADAPDEPGYRIRLGEYLRAGDVAERAEAVALWTSVADDARHVTSTLRAQALEHLARAAATSGDLAQTTTLIDRAVALPVDAGLRRQLEAEAFALHHDGPAGAALRGYFYAPQGFPIEGAQWAQLAILAEPELGFASYLLGIQRANASEWQLAAEALDTALARGVPGPAFVRNGARKLAISAYRVGDLERVRRAIAALSDPALSQTDHLLAEDWTRRLTFDQTGHL